MSKPVFAKAARWIAPFLLAVFTAGAALAVEPINSTVPDTVAIEGYDPVAYFKVSAPVKGESNFEHRWMNATWRFQNAENRDEFAADPGKYSPQYGGYCAFGVSRGYAVAVDPTAWTIVDGKLYLNYDHDVQKLWSADIPGFISKADQNWPRVLKE